MPDRWPVVITDDDGHTIDVSPEHQFGAGTVLLWTSPDGVTLDAAQLEEFAQAVAAASHEIERQARPAPCGAVPPGDWDAGETSCGQYGDHGEHIAREAGGIIVASWPVSDG